MDLKKKDTIYATILERKPLQVTQTSIKNLDIVASHILLSNTDIDLTVAKDHREARLKRALDAIRDEYEFIIIDCPPILSWLTINAFTASDEVVVVVSPGYFELDSIVQISKTIEEVQEYFNPDLMLRGYLFTKSDPTLNSKVSLKILRQTYTEQVLRTVIPMNTDIRDAHFNKKDIFSFSPRSKSAEGYRRLIKELFYEEETE